MIASLVFVPPEEVEGEVLAVIQLQMVNEQGQVVGTETYDKAGFAEFLKNLKITYKALDECAAAATRVFRS